ncbi:MAG: LysR substrate-binding domain-containing protein [Ilumatobacteraceae bacterium]
MRKSDDQSFSDGVPLNAVRVFDAAAFSGSFSAAARRLGIGQSTISRHISTLERWLGVPLFSRTSSSSELTTEGRQLSQTTRTCFADLDQALGHLRRSRENLNRVTVDVSVTFAALWLLPRLDQFTSQYPDADIRVVTRNDSAAPAHDADIVVSFGHADGDIGDTPIAPERLVVIRSPRYDMRSDPATLISLATEHLLGLDGPTHHDDWLIFFGSAPPPVLSRYSSYTVYLQAVLEGHGIGLGWRPLIDQHLDDGRLIEVGDWDVTTERSYYISARRPSTPIVHAFANWLTLDREESADWFGSP